MLSQFLLFAFDAIKSISVLLSSGTKYCDKQFVCLLHRCHSITPVFPFPIAVHANVPLLGFLSASKFGIEVAHYDRISGFDGESWFELVIELIKSSLLAAMVYKHEWHWGFVAVQPEENYIDSRWVKLIGNDSRGPLLADKKSDSAHLSLPCAQENCVSIFPGSSTLRRVLRWRSRMMFFPLPGRDGQWIHLLTVTYICKCISRSRACSEEATWSNLRSSAAPFSPGTYPPPEPGPKGALGIGVHGFSNFFPQLLNVLVSPSLVRLSVVCTAQA